MSRRPDSRLSVRFGDEVLQRGHTAVPNLVLNYYACLGLSPAEMLFTIHVWQHWWTERDPHPSLRTIAGRMGVSGRQAKRYVEALERKGFLHVVERFALHGGQLTNEFDYSPLIRAVVEAARAERAVTGPEQVVTRPRHREGGVTSDTPWFEPSDPLAPLATDPPGASEIVTPAHDGPGAGAHGCSVTGGDAPPSPKEECTEEDDRARYEIPTTRSIERDNLDVHMACARPGPCGPLTAAQLWAATLASLVARIDEGEMEAWLRPARVVAGEDGVVVLVAPTTVACRRIEQRYAEMVRAALAALVGRPVALSCVSRGEWEGSGVDVAGGNGGREPSGT